MKGFNNFHLTLLVGAIVAGIFAVIWAYQPTVTTLDSPGGEIAVPAETGVPRTLSATEIRDRFAGHIVEGVHEIRNFTFTHYYDPDGGLISARSDRQRTRGTWRVSNDNRLCIHFKGNEELCRGVIEIDGVTKKFVKTRSGKTKIVVTFKSFRAGGPGDI